MKYMILCDSLIRGSYPTELEFDDKSAAEKEVEKMNAESFYSVYKVIPQYEIEGILIKKEDYKEYENLINNLGVKVKLM